MAKTTKTKAWSKILEHRGVRLRLYERPGGMVWCSRVVGREDGQTRKARVSLKTKDRAEAERRAVELAEELALMELAGVDPAAKGYRLTLGELFDLYRVHKLPTMKPQRQKEALARIAMFTDAWGAGLAVLDIDQTRVDAYVQKRRTLAVVSPGLRPDADGKRRRGYRKPKPARDGALHGELSWLSTVCNGAHGFRVNGRRLLPENPVRGLEWPKEKNPRRPIASHQRFTRTLEHVDAVDPMGRLRCILELARWTGRRESAICQIRAPDLLLTEDRMRAALAAAGMDERLADHMPHGAIRWAAESDKEGFLFISPISRPARAAVDAYLRKNPRIGDVPLFPGPRDASKPVRRERAATWLLKAEALAGLPKLVGGVFHPYRRLWATERKALADTDVAAAGGWRDTRALKTSYQQPDPATVLQVVEHGS